VSIIVESTSYEILSAHNRELCFLIALVSSSYFHGRRVTDLGKSGLNSKESNRNFLSIIRRARVSQSPENKSILFTEYEIVCQMRLLADTLAEKEIVYKWSVWKRFSEFVILHKVFRYPTLADIVINQ
jgi:hypothetical protein